MECFRCQQPAQGVCRFCGRALCAEHFQSRPFILTIFIGKQNIPKVVAVSDVLYCGHCKPQAEPIEMPELY